MTISMLTRRQLLKSLAIAPFVPAVAAQPKWHSYSSRVIVEDGVFKPVGPWTYRGPIDGRVILNQATK